MSVLGSGANTITVSLVGDASRLQKSLSDSQRAVSAFGLAATAALVAFGVSSAKAFEERAQAQEKLNFALSKSATLSGLSAESLKKYNDQLAAKVAIDDDVIAGAEAILTRFATTESQLKNLTELSADYARITGTDISAAATTVGKALLGNTRALKALGISYTATGNQAKDAAAIQQLLNEKIGGYAEKYAQTAAGKTEELKRQYGELQETVGAALVPAFTDLLDVLNPVLNTFGKLPKPVQQGVFFVSLFGAAALAVGPRILAMRAALAENNITLAATAARAKTATSAYGGLAGKAGAAAAAIGLGAVAIQASGANDQLSKMNETSVTMTMALKQQSGQFDNWANTAQHGVAEVIDGLFGVSSKWDIASDKVNALDQRLAQLVASGHADKAAAMHERFAEALAADGGNIDEMDAALPGYTAALGKAGGTTAVAAQKSETLADRIQKVIDKFTILRQGFLDQRDANRAFQQAIDDANKALKDNGKTLSDNTSKGRANSAALDAIATSGNDVITSLVKQGASSDKVKSKYQELRGELVQQAQQFGMTKTQAQKYVAQVLKTPKTVKTQADFVDDSADLEGWLSWLDRIPGHVQTTVTTVVGVTDQSRGSSGRHQATGGLITGPGTGTSDSIPVMLSNGEYVINAGSARRIGLSNLNRLNKMADGGVVGGQHWANAFMQDNKVFSKLQELVSAAKDQLKEIKGQRRDYAQNTSSGLMSGLSLGGAVQQHRDNDPASLLGRYRQQANKIRRFMRDVSRLQKKGLGRALTQEILDMGSDEGDGLARTLLTDPAMLAQFNRVYSRIDQDTTRFGNREANLRYRRRINEAADDLHHARRVERRVEHHIIIDAKHAGHMSDAESKQLAKDLSKYVRQEIRALERQNR